MGVARLCVYGHGMEYDPAPEEMRQERENTRCYERWAIFRNAHVAGSLNPSNASQPRRKLKPLCADGPMVGVMNVKLWVASIATHRNSTLLERATELKASCFSRPG